jgi:hypothetical protein
LRESSPTAWRARADGRLASGPALGPPPPPSPRLWPSSRTPGLSPPRPSAPAKRIGRRRSIVLPQSDIGALRPTSQAVRPSAVALSARPYPSRVSSHVASIRRAVGLSASPMAVSRVGCRVSDQLRQGRSAPRLWPCGASRACRARPANAMSPHIRPRHSSFRIYAFSYIPDAPFDLFHKTTIAPRPPIPTQTFMRLCIHSLV